MSYVKVKVMEQANVVGLTLIKGSFFLVGCGFDPRSIYFHVMVNSALHSYVVAKSSTSFGSSFCWGKGGNVTSAGWQLTLCDPTWHVSSCTGEACKLLYHSLHYFFTWCSSSGVARILLR